jgi:glutaredoxin 3
MAKVVMYTKPGCPYCARAKALLQSKNVQFEEIVASGDPDLRAQMIERSGGRNTFPQIFIGARHVGGSDDLHDLDRAGGLDRLLREG